MTPRRDRRFVVFPDRYRRLDRADFDEMYQDLQERYFKNPERPDGIVNVAQSNYVRKFNAAFTHEMTRSVRAILQNWLGTGAASGLGPSPDE